MNMEQETRQRKPYQGVQCKLIDFGRGQAMFAAGSGDSTTGTFYNPRWFATQALFVERAPAWLEHYNRTGTGPYWGLQYVPDGSNSNIDWGMFEDNYSLIPPATMANLLNTFGPAETWRQMYDCDQTGPIHHSPSPYWFGSNIFSPGTPECSWWESYYGGDCAKGNYCC